MAEKQYKLDIFKVLSKISTKDANYYASLSEDEQKALQPLVVMRWLSGTKSAQQVYFLNEFVNRFVFPFTNHKELLVDLMTVCTSGSSQRYSWKKQKTKKGNKMPTVTKVISDYYKYSLKDAADALCLLPDDVVLSCAEELGRQPDDIKLIKKELKTRI